ncbi:MAG: hypothetical protein H5T69_15255 [Chloroflexi bacterium]|nr:hypothetical protein [Chloroflexota bacterium]
MDVEDMQVHTVERMRRLFALLLIAALFVYYIANVWPESAVKWLLDLGGKLHLKLVPMAPISCSRASRPSLSPSQPCPLPPDSPSQESA